MAERPPKITTISAQIQVDEKQRVEIFGEKHGLTMSELIRLGLDLMLSRKSPPKQCRLLRPMKPKGRPEKHKKA